jgi:hypothetical protein
MVLIQDELGENLCPVGETSFAQIGSIDITLIGKGDKRMYTLGVYN